jgi:glyoxylase-like metal-dependent hydrolase (beta-lactamase superfamily II)
MVPAVPPQLPAPDGRQVVDIGGRAWRCIAGYGHAPEHIALYCDALGVLISGDMVLPRISTNVSVYDLEPEADPLALFLDSHRPLRAAAEDTLVLPSHGKPFTGLHARIASCTTTTATGWPR